MIVYGGDLEPPTGSDRRSSELGLEPGEYLLYVSRFEPENNPDRVVEAYRRVGGITTAWSWSAARPTPRGLTRRVARARRRAGRAARAGLRRRLPATALQLPAYIHATEVGGTHPALVEAMGAGRPVLYYDTPENREVAGDAGVALPVRRRRRSRATCSDALLDDEERLSKRWAGGRGSGSTSATAGPTSPTPTKRCWRDCAEGTGQGRRLLGVDHRSGPHHPGLSPRLVAALPRRAAALPRRSFRPSSTRCRAISVCCPWCSPSGPSCWSPARPTPRAAPWPWPSEVWQVVQVVGRRHPDPGGGRLAAAARLRVAAVSDPLRRPSISCSCSPRNSSCGSARAASGSAASTTAPCSIVGINPRAEEVARIIAEHPHWGLKLLGFVAPNGEHADEVAGLPVLGQRRRSAARSSRTRSSTRSSSSSRAASSRSSRRASCCAPSSGSAPGSPSTSRT